MRRYVVIQLARLGDIVQSLPVVSALRTRHAGDQLDMVCPAPLTEVAAMLPGLDRVVGWDGARWQRLAGDCATGVTAVCLRQLEEELTSVSSEPYDRAYILNQHPRAILAGTLLARDTVGPLARGPLSGELTPWAAYIREIARTRKANHVHLSDAWCGLCGVIPPPPTIRCRVPAVSLPARLDRIGEAGAYWMGVVVGAGDPVRQIPLNVWRAWMLRFFERVPKGRLVLIGQGADRERARVMQEKLPSSVLGRVWDATGRTTLPELAVLLARCTCVIGSDTGPLHLAAAVGTPVQGWYLARARVHETGPYGAGHLVWQAEGGDGGLANPVTWPIEASVAACLHEPPTTLGGWSVWLSQRDARGTYYTRAGAAPSSPPDRDMVWNELHHAVAE